jgi:hypothetical protein
LAIAENEVTLSAPRPIRFNVQGPCVPASHYLIPPLTRLPEALDLIKANESFIIKAPPQSGKTTFARAAVDQINAEGSKYAIYLSFEGLAAISDCHEAINAIIDRIELAQARSQVAALRNSLDHSSWDKLAKFRKLWWAQDDPLIGVITTLTEKLDKELTIFFDDVDCLAERPLRFFVHQLREGYVECGEEVFPRSIVLLGALSVEGVTTNARPESKSLGAMTPFYDAKKVLTLPDFTQEDIRALFARHAKISGQVFREKGLEEVWLWSSGQPWAVNALGDEVVKDTLGIGKNRRAIDGEDVNQAASKIINRHYDQTNSVFARLSEPAVRKFTRPLAFSDNLDWSKREAKIFPEEFQHNLQYCLDLGLVKNEPTLNFANNIYFNIIRNYLARDITQMTSEGLINLCVSENKGS